MRVHFLSITAILVAFLFVSGAVGCKSNGGDWYKPTSYSFVNPFAKEEADSPRSPTAFANNSKPSLNDQPNLRTPDGGYSTGSNLADAGSGSRAGTSVNSPLDSWGQANPMASQTPPSHLGGYSSVAEPSYLPSYGMEGQIAGNPYGNQYGNVAAPQQSMAHQQGAQQSQPLYHHDPYNAVPQYGQNAPAQNMPYGTSDYLQTSATSNIHQSQPTQQIPTNIYGAEQQGNYAPFGTLSQTDPYGINQQQPTMVPSGYETQPATNPYGGYPGEGVQVASPYPTQSQPYQPPAAGTANYPNYY